MLYPCGHKESEKTESLNNNNNEREGGVLPVSFTAHASVKHAAFAQVFFSFFFFFVVDFVIH